MGTKQEQAVQRAFLRGKKQSKIREEKHVLTALTAALVVLLYLLLAQHNGWWPYARPKLGSAFYTNVSASTTAPNTSSSSGSNSGGSQTGSGSSGTTGTAGSGNTGSGGSSGGSAGGSGGSTPIANFAAGINLGNTMAQTNGQANGLGQNCAIVVGANASGAGQQQVCTYTEGNKIVTVTYLNNRVISASKSGF